MTLDTSHPVKRVAIGLIVLVAVPLTPAIVWVHAQYRRLLARFEPDCPVCGDAARGVDGVGYVCDRPGCVAYGDDLDRARRRDTEAEA